jgi:S1/P1 Nuclease
LVVAVFRLQSTDCPNNVCLYAAILNYTQRITTQTGTQQNEALKFLTHFLGDIHQPLHVSFASDLGGNTLTGTFLGESGNLHHVRARHFLARCGWNVAYVCTGVFEPGSSSGITVLLTHASPAILTTTKTLTFSISWI